MTTKQVSVRLAAVGGKQVKAELVDIGRAGERSFQQLDRSARGNTGGLQNVGYQVQDFAVQVASGTDASRALAQQLPQLLSGFGLFGVMAGTAAAVLIPLAGYLFNVNEEAQSLDTTLRDMEASVRALAAVTEQYSIAGVTDLTERYGELNAEVLLLIQRQRELAVDNALGQAKAAVAGLEAQFGGLFSTRQGDIADLLGVESSVRQIDDLGNAVRAINPVVAEFDAAMQAVSDATTFEAQADAVSNLLALMEGTAAQGTEVWDKLVQAEDALRQMAASGAENSGWLTSMVGQAGDLAAQLWDAASAAWSVSAGQASAKAKAKAFGQDTGSAAWAQNSLGFNLPGSELLPPEPKAKGRRKGGGGGGGGNRQSDEEREAARIYEKTRTEAEKYAIELEKLNKLQAGGFITADTYDRALDDLAESTKRAGEAANAMESAFGEAFTSFVTGAKSAQEAVSDLLGSLAEVLANRAFETIASSLFGGGGGGFLSGLFGGGRAGGGPVKAGVSYMVGEAGVERFTPATDGYITPNASLSGATGGVTVQIDARGAQEGVAEQIARVMEPYATKIVQASVAASRAAAARGI